MSSRLEEAIDRYRSEFGAEHLPSLNQITYREDGYHLAALALEKAVARGKPWTDKDFLLEIGAPQPPTSPEYFT